MSLSKTVFLQIFLTLTNQYQFSQSDCFYNLYNWVNRLPNTTKEEISTRIILEPPHVSPDDVSFLLYPSSSNESISLEPSTLHLLNSSHPTRIIIHGWDSDGKEPWIQEMALRYHQTQSCNVVALDWSKHADNDYLYAAAATQFVGRILGDFILKTGAVSKFLDKLHLVGHSLGGHVAGFAGKRVRLSGSKIGRISGLDVAAPLFEIPILQNWDCRLSKSDASFVDLIHTQIGIRGVIQAFGNVDFYVNGGLIQLLCPQDLPNLDEAISCGHGSAHVYFTKTIVEPEAYEAVACNNFTNFLSGVCSKNATAFMGEAVSRSVSGTFYLIIDYDGNAP